VSRDGSNRLPSPFAAASLYTPARSWSRDVYPEGCQTDRKCDGSASRECLSTERRAQIHAEPGALARAPAGIAVDLDVSGGTPASRRSSTSSSSGVRSPVLSGPYPDVDRQAQIWLAPSPGSE